MLKVTKREAARRDLVEHFVYLAENAGLDVAERFLTHAEASFGDLGFVRKELEYWAAELGCDARREARRVASHTSDLQQRSAPETSEPNVQVIDERALSGWRQLPWPAKIVVAGRPR